MYLKIFVIFATLQLSFAEQPVIYQQDNSIITNDLEKLYLPQHYKFIPAQYPYYKVITGEVAIPKPIPTPKPDTLPADLIEIARKKLDIDNVDQIPSVSELGELLGTTSKKETISLLRQLTATENGIELIKAFIESSDYKDKIANKDPVAKEADTSGPLIPTSLVSETVQKNFEVIQKVLTTPKPDLGFFQRVSSYLNVFDLFPRNTAIPISPANKEVQELNQNESHHQHHPDLRTISVTNNFSHSLPVAIKPSNDRILSTPVSAFNNRLDFRRYRHYLG